MSEDIIVCKKCKSLMELYKSYGVVFSDGEVHSIEEYRCRPCRITLKRDLGPHVPDSQSYTQTVNNLQD